MTQSIPLTQAPSHHLLQGIANATNRLCTVQDDDDAVQQALFALGERAKVDRISVMENCACASPVAGIPAMVQRCEWITPSYGMPGANVPAFLNRSYAQGWDRWLTLLRQGSLVVMAEQDCAGNERDLLLSQGLRALLLVPIILRNEFWGAVRFDNYRFHRAWTALEQSALSTFGSTLGGAIVQRRDHARLRQQSARS
ncbi:MAG: GAF domain-containing protein, partial [Cyanobacteria bacterium P01_H01_bin.130]